MLPEIHRPQVWVERDDLDKARPVLEAYERRAAELHDASGEEVPVGPEIEVACEECGERSTFPVSQRGSVQVCEHCGAFVDVDVPGNANEWEESPGEGEMPEGK